jgi:hypothetical protein
VGSRRQGWRAGHMPLYGVSRLPTSPTLSRSPRTLGRVVCLRGGEIASVELSYFTTTVAKKNDVELVCLPKTPSELKAR